MNMSGDSRPPARKNVKEVKRVILLWIGDSHVNNLNIMLKPVGVQRKAQESLTKTSRVDEQKYKQVKVEKGVSAKSSSTKEPNTTDRHLLCLSLISHQQHLLNWVLDGARGADRLDDDVEGPGPGDGAVLQLGQVLLLGKALANSL